tara:strand:+ start:2378 stop:3304 length:927 start_codon:yes stop_codon:yes gene_type:complete
MIQVKNLVKNYNDIKAVQSIDFTINDGEIVGFLGANGAGKSTTLKILTGYISPTSGDVTINGQNIQDNSYEIRKMIGYLPESNPLYADMTVFDLLKFTANVRNIHNNDFKSAFERVINQCGLQGVVHKKVGACSKGYKQRVGLACAMIHDPKILILDEPVTGLDPNQIVEVRELIKNLGKEKLVLMSSHILQEIEATVDRIIIIDNGKIVADGSTDSLLKQFMGSVNLKLSVQGATKSALNVMSKEIENIKMHTIEKTGKTYMVNIEYNIESDPRVEIFNYIVKNKWILLEMNPQIANLEDIFRKLTK